MNEKNLKFMADLHAPEYVPSLQFKSLACMKCKQGFHLRENKLHFFETLSEMWAFAKREHRNSPLPCVTPELVVTYEVAIISASIVKTRYF